MSCSESCSVSCSGSCSANCSVRCSGTCGESSVRCSVSCSASCSASCSGTGAPEECSAALQGEGQGGPVAVSLVPGSQGHSQPCPGAALHTFPLGTTSSRSQTCVALHHWVQHRIKVKERGVLRAKGNRCKISNKESSKTLWKFKLRLI